MIDCHINIFDGLTVSVHNNTITWSPKSRFTPAQLLSEVQHAEDRTRRRLGQLSELREMLEKADPTPTSSTTEPT